MGRSECGKTTLTQAMRGEAVHYQKTQYINFHDVVIDTPGEYAENKFRMYHDFFCQLQDR